MSEQTQKPKKKRENYLPPEYKYSPQRILTVAKEAYWVDPDDLVAHPAMLSTIYPLIHEFVRRLDAPLDKYEPDDSKDRNQKSFHASTSDIRLVFGGNQSGKSFCAAIEAAWWLLGNHPWLAVPQGNCKVYCISANYRTLQEGIYRHLKDLLPTWEIEREGPSVANYVIPSYIELKNGSKIEFISGEGAEDARRKVQAAAIHLAILDEEVDGRLWNELQARLMKHDGRVVVSATLIRSEAWCLALEDRAETGDEKVHMVRLSSERAAEVGHISKKKVEEFKNNLSADEYQVRVLGKSRRHQGLVYSDFGRQHVCAPFEIPKNWTRYCAIDPGLKVFAVLYIAVDPEGRRYIYKEHYFRRSNYMTICDEILKSEGYVPNPHKHGQWMKTQETEELCVRLMDPAGFGTTETGEMKHQAILAIRSVEMGVGSALSCAKAQNEVQAGIQLCARALMEMNDEKPLTRVFSTCENFLTEVRTYRWNRDDRPAHSNEPRDTPVKRSDHLMDCWRYLENFGLQFRELTFKPDYEVPFKVTASMEETVKKDWEQILQLQRQGPSPPQHPGGIGDVY